MKKLAVSIILVLVIAVGSVSATPDEPVIIKGGSQPAEQSLGQSIALNAILLAQAFLS